MSKVIILRGPACSGKTTIGRTLRNFDEKITWLNVDKVKEIYSHFEDRALDESHKSVNAITADLLERGYNVIIDGIFKKPEYTKAIQDIAREKNADFMVYELECSLPTLLARDKNREGTKIWGSLGDELVTSLYNTVKENPIEGSIKLNTEELTPEECVEKIYKGLR